MATNSRDVVRLNQLHGMRSTRYLIHSGTLPDLVVSIPMRKQSMGRSLQFVRYAAVWSVLLICAILPAFAVKVPRGFDQCKTLDSCMGLLDSVFPSNDTGDWDNSEVIARKLERFGVQAKLELLERATGSDPGRHRSATQILAYWKDWDAKDISALQAALKAEPGGWAASALEEIATPDAIRVLVSDIPHGEGNFTEAALERLSLNAAPYMLPAFEDDAASAEAARIIEGMLHPPTEFTTQWVVVALDEQKPTRQRIGALRAIGALGIKAKSAGIQLHGLLANEALKIEAGKTLRALRDPIVAVDTAKACQPSAEQFDFLALKSSLCLREIAEFGPDGQAAGEYLTPFLTSPNGAEQAYGILTLGFLGYAPATAKFEDALSSKDWRIVYAAISSVGWMGDKQAISALNKLASGFWMAEIRKQAALTVSALQTSKGVVERGSWVVDDRGVPRDPTWVITEGADGIRSSCKSNRWQWQSQTFALTPDPEAEAHALRFRIENMAGELIGTDHGEWGGSLTWVPFPGTPTVLDRDNVHGLEYADEGSIVLFGLAHLGFNYGYALKVIRKVDGTWEQTELARLPGEPRGSVRMDNGDIAVLSGGRVLVLSQKDGILGIAACAPK